MLAINNETSFNLEQHASVRSIKEQTFFMLDSKNGAQYDLTDMEYKIVCLIKNQKCFSDITNDICVEYNYDKVQIEADLKEYIESLVEAELVSII